jgi:biopolymer transport protein ExbD
MLVLLIIFIITVPVMKHAVNVDLPKASSQREGRRQARNRAPDRAGRRQLLLERIQKIADDAVALPRLQAEAAKQPQPDLHIRGDKAVRYERVAQAMAAAQQAGLRKIGFITEPKP